MLTLSKVTNAGAASAYYSSADDYYAEGGAAPSAWFGRGSKFLGLEGPVDGDVFAQLLDGRVSTETQMHRGGSGDRIGAFDLTFSAPKSVSMQALIGDDKRLVHAHERAVTQALEHVESQIASYRERDNDKMKTYESGNVVAATFQHAVSRELDPQLHTHAVTMNMTRRPDGAWRALDAKPLLEQQKLVGAIYRGALAREIEALGYGIRVTHHDGRFELNHIPQAAIEAFSTRRRSIDAALAARGLDRKSASAGERQVATLQTRKRKATEMSRAMLVNQWTERAAKFDVQWYPQLESGKPAIDRQAAVSQAVAFAIEHLTERTSAPMTVKLEAVALGRVLGAGTLGDIRAELRRLAETKSVMFSEDKRRFTTTEAQAIERDTLRIEEHGRNVLGRGILAKGFRLSDEQRQALTSGQALAVKMVLTTSNRVVGIQGHAGTGKTTMLRTVAKNLPKDYRIVGTAPSAAAARELTKAGVEATTIASFLLRGSRRLDKQTLVVVDEASMVSARSLHALLSAVEQAGARVVLVGDTRQLAAVEAGAPFRQLQENNMDVATMAEVLRQTDARLREAVEAAAAGNATVAIDLLKHATQQIVDDGSRHKEIARAYVRERTAGRDTLAVAGTNQARRGINGLIREALDLAGKGVAVAVLERQDLTQAQLRSSLSYQPGVIVEFLRAYPSIGASVGDTAEVVSSEPGNVQLLMKDGTIQAWRPTAMPYVAAHCVGARELAVGDLVRFTANLHALDVVNGERAEVRSIDVDGKSVSVSTSDGRGVVLDTSRYLHLDHGYCTTVHAAQGQTCDSVLIDADAFSVTANESLFYVAISRARSLAAIYTDDSKALPEAMSREHVQTTALEIEPKAPRQAELAL